MNETVSENLFIQYCDNCGYKYLKLDTDNSTRMPDFEITTPKGKVIFEVKEIHPNKEDFKLFQEIKTEGKGSWSRPIGKRVSDAIKDAKGQLKKFQNEKIPLVILLYELLSCKEYSPFLKNQVLSDTDIDSGMFGKPIVYFFPKGKPENFQKPIFNFGGNQKLTKMRGRYISAIGVLIINSKNEIYINFYHNPYANAPLFPEYFKNENDIHYVKNIDPNKFGQGWLEYIGPR